MWCSWFCCFPSSYRSNGVEYTTEQFEIDVFEYLNQEFQIEQTERACYSLSWSIDSHFSFIRWNSESGEAELRLAEKYDEASIYSVGSSTQSDDFVKRSSDSGEKNVWRFESTLSDTVIQAFTESPEFVRYQVGFWCVFHVVRSYNNSLFVILFYSCWCSFYSSRSINDILFPPIIEAAFDCLSVFIPWWFLSTTFIFYWPGSSKSEWGVVSPVAASSEALCSIRWNLERSIVEKTKRMDGADQL